MQLSGIIVNFEKSIREYLATRYGGLNLTKPQYSITRLGQGKYDITLTVSGLGVQHIYVAIVGDELLIKGKVALIGDKAAFPFAIFADLVNNSVLRWLERSMDSASTITPGTAIKFVEAEKYTLIEPEFRKSEVVVDVLKG